MTELYTSLQDSSAMARFYDEPKLHPFKTKEARRTNPDAEPVYIPQIMIEIHIKGSSEVMRRAMQESDKQKFSTAWAAFEGDDVAPDAGTNLDVIENMDDVTITQYAAKGIKSVEDLANVSDGVITQLGRGAVTHKQSAQEYLKKHQGIAGKGDIIRRIEKLEQTVSEILRKGGVDDLSGGDDSFSNLNEIVLDLGNRLAELEKPKPKRGRPAKTLLNEGNEDDIT